MPIKQKQLFPKNKRSPLRRLPDGRLRVLFSREEARKLKVKANVLASAKGVARWLELPLTPHLVGEVKRARLAAISDFEKLQKKITVKEANRLLAWEPFSPPVTLKKASTQYMAEEKKVIAKWKLKKINKENAIRDLTFINFEKIFWLEYPEFSPEYGHAGI